jgi:hypothetical protein
MGKSVSQKAECIHCGHVLSPQHTGPCPECGKEGKKIDITINETLLLRDSLKWETRKEYYEKHKGALGIVIAITVLSPFLGLVLAGPIGVALGLVLSVLAYFLGLKAVTKVIEKTKGHA